MSVPPDPLRTTDHDPKIAPSSRGLPLDHVSSSSVVGGVTDAYVPGLGAETLPTTPSRGSGTASVPGYEIERVLGRGGMGVVYKAQHLALKRTVALKMILVGAHAGPQERARFRIEAEAVARLQHPNIVQIHEVGEADGHCYCALEFVEGGDLASKLDGKPMPPREAARLVEALARAMQLAHSRNVVHRDLKPANILLTGDGTPKISDFGLARQTDSDSGETQAGAVMGTPSYMAPEQASGLAHEAGPAADVYALGAILYDCLTGRPPFKGETVVETLDQVRTQEPIAPSRLQRGVPLDLETICLKCLRKEPEKRYASASELADELVRYLKGEPILARPVGRLERGWRWCKRNPAVATLLASVLLLLTAGIAVSSVLAMVAREEAANAKLSEGRAIEAGNLEKKANTELTRKQDELLTTVAEGWMGPLGVQVEPNQPLPPLLLQEIVPLWNLASTPDERLRPRFVEVALRDPDSTRHLKDRAAFAFQAAVGIDPARRARVEEVLARRMLTKGIPPREEEHVAFCLAHLGVHDRSLAGRVAAILSRALLATTDKNEGPLLAHSLSVLAPRLDTRQAAEVFATLTRALTEATNRTNLAAPLPPFVTALAAVADRMEIRREAHRRVVAAFPPIMRRVIFVSTPARLSLAESLSVSTAHADPQQVAETADAFAKFILTLRAPLVAGNCTQILAVMTARLEPGKAAPICEPVAAFLAQEFMNTKMLASERPNVIEGLSSIAARLDPRKADEICGPVAVSLAEAVTKATAAYEIAELAGKIDQVKKGDEPWQLAELLSLVATRLEPKRAGQVCGPVATALTRTLTTASDIKGHLMGAPSRVLSQVAARLEPDQAAEVAAALTRAMTMTVAPYTLRNLSTALSGVLPRLEPRKAAEVSAQAVAVLTREMSRTTYAFTLEERARDLLAVTAFLEPKRAAEASVILTQALTEAKEPKVWQPLALGLATVSARMEARPGIDVCGRAATPLTRVLNTKMSTNLYRDFVRGLSGAAVRLEPKAAAVVAALAEAMSRTTDPDTLQSLSEGLSAILSGEAPLLPAETLVALLKHPLCVGEPRRLVLAQLSRHYHRPFADLWEFVAHVTEKNLPLDLTTPPVRPQDQLTAFLKGEFRPTTNDERLELIELCGDRSLHRTLAGLYAEAFASDPQLGDHRLLRHRYHAARSAVLASAGQGEDAALLDDAARAELRRKALDWLRVDLTAWGKETSRPAIQRAVGHWRVDGDLATIRDKAALAKLPAGEQKEFTRFWTDVARVENDHRDLAAAQVENVRRLLMTQNLDYKGAFTPTIQDESITGLNFNGDAKVKNLSAIKGLPLKTLDLMGTAVVDLTPLEGMPLETLMAWGWGGTDLSPLKGMPLRWLNCGGGGQKIDLSPLAGLPLTFLCVNHTQVSDLGPLKDVPLTRLLCTYTAVTDLTPLRKIRLKELALVNCKVSDLTPIQGLPIQLLEMQGTSVTDLSPLKGMPLEEIRLTPKNITKGMEILREMKSLKVIGINEN